MRAGFAALVLMALGALVAQSGAFQGPSRPEDDRGRRPGPPPPPPRSELLDLFDTDRDGALSAKEIDASADLLRELDRDGDGRVEGRELPRPPRPGDRPGDRRRGGREDAPPRRERPDDANAEPGTVLIRGGHETDRRDGGRPVALIAGALGVTPDVFRDAFSRVVPARGGAPTPDHARRNKAVLMAALGKHGVTNDRLDAVSNEYRYQPQRGDLWRHRPATATAVIRDGRVVSVKLIEHGSGYTTPPTVTIAGHPDVRLVAKIAFDAAFARNGRVTSLELVNP